jgi:GNAT superfamily N-acetyltransferase
VTGAQRSRRSTGAKLDVHPLTPERWSDLEMLFGARGCSVARGCWCMFYRRSGAEPVPPGMRRAEFNRGQLRTLVDTGTSPGLIGYRDGVPVGWISLGPREQYPKLARSPVMKPVDDRPVWSIVCFVVPAAYRRQGVAAALLSSAVAWARRRGVRLLEASPVDRTGPRRDDSLWFGTASMFERAGFDEVARRKRTRPVVRKSLRKS